MKIALVTYQDKGAYAAINVNNEDDILIAFLSAKGLNVTKEIWNDASANWKNYDLAIIKSPWDYFDFIDDFYKWLAELERDHIKVLNPVSTLKWNADKHYLLDIENAGFNVTPSIFLKQGVEIELNSYFGKLGVEKFIVKPVVSGGSKNTFKITAANVSDVNEKLKDLIKQEDFIIQPFLKEIEAEGEWSFLFFNGKFSHALLKKAKAGDFRVQATFGGTVNIVTPNETLIASAQKYVDSFANNCLYARVDGAVVDGDFMLMELELIEPFLFLETNTMALENYYQALKSLM